MANNSQYLDLNGLQYVWDNITNTFVKKGEIDAQIDEITDSVTEAKNAATNAANAVTQVQETIAGIDTAAIERVSQAIENLDETIADDVKASITATDLGAVSFQSLQGLNDDEKDTARKNLGLDNIDSLVTGTVKYSEVQTLEPTQKTRARENIGAASVQDTTLSTTLSRGRDSTKVTGVGSLAFGYNVVASGEYSQSFGNTSVASGAYSHAVNNSTASGTASHAQGSNTTASGVASSSEGSSTAASGDDSHAEGTGSIASGTGSHAENMAKAQGAYSHAENSGTSVGRFSHASGEGTVANGRNQNVFGKFNVNDTTESEAEHGTYVEIVGNGTTNENRSNARTLDWEGNEVLAGTLTVGTDPENDMDVATKKYVDDSIEAIPESHHGVCGTAAEKSVKYVSLADRDIVPEEGIRITVNFQNGNTANNPSIFFGEEPEKEPKEEPSENPEEPSENPSEDPTEPEEQVVGAPIKYHGEVITSGAEKELLVGMCDLFFDGEAWHLLGGGTSSGAGDSIAQNFDPETPYVVGKYVIYDGDIYKFTSPHPAGEWTGEDAVLVPSVMDEIIDVKTEVDIELANTVQYVDQTSSLTDEMKSIARTNIGAVSAAEVENITAQAAGAVKYTDQDLDSDQQQIARNNIGAASVADVTNAVSEKANISDLNNLIASVTKNDTIVTVTKKDGSSNQFELPKGILFDSGECRQDTNTGAWYLYLKYNGAELPASEYVPIEIPAGLAFDSGKCEKGRGTEYNEDPDKYYLYLTLKDNYAEGFTPFELIGGGGGGGVSSSISLSNVTRPTSIRNGSDAYISFVATSSDDTPITVAWKVDGVAITDVSTGDMTVTPPGGIAASGLYGDSGSTFTFNAKNYLRESNTSTIAVTLTNEGEASLSRSYTITSTAFSVEWAESISPVMLYTSDENIFVVVNVYAPARSTNNVVLTIGSNTVSKSRTGSGSLTFEINKSLLSYGTNTIKAVLVSSEDSNERSNEIQYIAIWGVGGNDPIVALSSRTYTVEQYSVLPVYYYVYDPNSESPSAQLTIGDNTTTVNPGRSLQLYNYVYQDAMPRNSEDKELESFEVNISLSCSVERVIDGETTVVTSTSNGTITVTKSKYDLGIVSGDNLVYYLNPIGHSNSDSDKTSFANLTFRGPFIETVNGEDYYHEFDWVNGGFQQDPNGVSAFVVKKGDRAVLDKSLFSWSDDLGKTIDISFKVVNADQYDAIAIKDTNVAGTKGVELRANEGNLYLGSSSGKTFRYCEETRIDVSFHVEGPVVQRITTIWLDGIPSMVNDYTADMLVQNDSYLTIGGDHCDVWVYNIRVYNTALDQSDMIQNYISNGNTTEDKVHRAIVNNIFDENGNITPETLHAAMPDLTIIEIEAERMSETKKDGVPAHIKITDGSSVLDIPSASAVSEGGKNGDGCFFKVQGTSSTAYARSALNMDIDMKCKMNFPDWQKNHNYVINDRMRYNDKNYFCTRDHTSGSEEDDVPNMSYWKEAKFKYKLSENSIAVNYLNIKVNVASSENANNICAVDWYNTYQPFLTEARKLNSSVRDTCEGKPCAVFFKNSQPETGGETVWVSSQQVKPGETILYVMGDLCNSKKNEEVFGQDNEGEHPTKCCIEVGGNETLQQRFRAVGVYSAERGEWDELKGYDDKGNPEYTIHYEWRMEPTDENLDLCVSAWDETVAWVVSTIDNPNKFKSEIGNYFIQDAMLYHFLMIEFFAAYDDVSKNTFYSFDWDENADQTKWNGYRWSINKAYDWDTLLAYDNDGNPLGDYGIDYGDELNGKSYFNAVDNPIWVNMQTGMYNELSALYIDRRSAGAWNATAIARKWDNYQAKRPHAAMVQDMYVKYIYPYKTQILSPDGTVKSGYDRGYLSRLAGSKTYQRKQFLTYQQTYMDGKYRYYNTSESLQFRTNGENATKTFSVKTYAKTYVTIVSNNNVMGRRKVEAGSTLDFEGVNVGGNSTIYVIPENLIQYIHPLNETNNSTFVAGGAVKLTDVLLGGTKQNTSWTDANVNVPSPILKEISIQNITNYNGALDLTANVELESVDTRGTQTGRVTLPNYAPLETIQLNSSTAVIARNLKKVKEFTMEGGSNLTSVLMENCCFEFMNPMMGYLAEAFANEDQITRHVRLTGIEGNMVLNAPGKTYDGKKPYVLENTDLLNKLLKAKRLDASGRETDDVSLLTGEVYVPEIKSNEYEAYAEAWPDLKVYPDTITQFYSVVFMNADGTPIKNKDGDDYVQYIQQGQWPYDPITTGEIDTPTLAPTQQWVYAFNSWDGLNTQIWDNNTVITATYSQSLRQYTVNWFKNATDTIPLKSVTVNYGTEAYYGDEIPVKTDAESNYVYSLFKGWDKSTGFVTEDMNVYAKWDTVTLGTARAKPLNEMSAVEVYAVAKSRSASTLFDNTKDYINITFGQDYDFDNIPSNTLIFTPTYFNGNGQRFEEVMPFKETATSITLAIDYEFNYNSDEACLCSICPPGSTNGFRLIKRGGEIIAYFGDVYTTVANGYNRGIVVIMYQKGSNSLYICSDYNGEYVNVSQYDSAYWEPSYSGYVKYRQSWKTTTLTSTQSLNENCILTYGGLPSTSPSGVEDPASGWVYWSKVWFGYLGTNMVNKLAAWPHETYKMRYRGSRIYNMEDGSTDGATFVMDCLFPQLIDFYGNSNTSAGWYNATTNTNSPARDFVRVRILNAFPIDWQAALGTVALKTTGGYNYYNELFTSQDQVYIPAVKEFNGTTSAPWKNESPENISTAIPWFNSNANRVRFAGLQRNNESIIYTSDGTSTDPTVTQTVTDGTVWAVRSNTSDPYNFYIYVQDSERHAYLGGRPKDSAVNITAKGVQGGKWIAAKIYYTRSPYAANNTSNYHHLVGWRGQTNYVYISSGDRRYMGFLIEFSL